MKKECLCLCESASGLEIKGAPPKLAELNQAGDMSYLLKQSKVRHVERKRELTGRGKGASLQDRAQRWLVQQREY